MMNQYICPVCHNEEHIDGAAFCMICGHPIPIKALTIWQPWSQLIIIGEKLVETRGHKTNIRGRIAIHAAKQDHSGILLHIPARELAFFQAAGVTSIPELPTGAVLGMAELVNCVPIEKLYGTEYDTPQERAFGDWNPGRFGWIFKQPVKFDQPKPAKGAQGFWNWTPPARFAAIKECRDFGALKASLTEKELETANRLCAEHDAGKCACEDSGEPDAAHCLAARWLEGCIATQDFIEELKAYG